MKPCQLCGAKSWGSVPGFVDVQVQPSSPQYFLIGKDLSQYRRCDNCGSYVSLVQMALEDPPRRDPVEDSLGILTPGPANPLTMARDMLQGMMPKPESRLERLVRAMLQSGTVRKDFIGPRDVVGYARDIESDLDAPGMAAAGTPLSPINQQFAALQAFVSRIESMTREGGALETGTSSAAALVHQALVTLQEALGSS